MPVFVKGHVRAGKQVRSHSRAEGPSLAGKKKFLEAMRKEIKRLGGQYTGRYRKIVRELDKINLEISKGG